MTEERSCNNCAIDLICQECNEDHSKWQPIAQDKPMENKVIFESEEQFVNFWRDITGCDCLPGIREKIKQKGYIRKSLLEEAEEMYDNYRSTMCYEETGLRVLVDKLYEVIQYLKAENERLKK